MAGSPGSLCFALVLANKHINSKVDNQEGGEVGRGGEAETDRGGSL